MTEEKLEIALRLKRSLEGRFADIQGFHLDAEHMGNAVLWNYGGFHGEIPLIGEVNGTVILEFPQIINCDSHTHLPSSLKVVTDIYERIEEYLERHGEKHERPCGHPLYYLKKGIPDS